MKTTFTNANESAALKTSKKEESNLAGMGRIKQKVLGKEEKDLRKDLHDIRREHLKEMRALKTNFKNEINMLKRKFDTQLRIEKDGHRKTYEEMRLLLQKGQEKMVKDQLREAIQNYSDIAHNYQKELQAIRQIQYEHEDIMRKKDAEIVQLKLELAKSNSDLQTRRMIIQLAERNAMIERLQSRIEEIETSTSQIPGSEEHEESEGRTNAADDNFDRRILGVLEGEQIRGNSYVGPQDIGSGMVQEGGYGEASIHASNSMSALDNDNGREERDSSPYSIDDIVEPRQKNIIKTRKTRNWL
jgi:hypothetical protein